MEQINKKEVDKKKVSVGFDAEKGVIGTKVKGTASLTCSPHDKLLIFFSDGSYKIINIPDRAYLHINDKKTAYIGFADKETTFRAVYKDPSTLYCYVKRFIVKQFIIDKEYRFFEEDMKLELLTTESDVAVTLNFKAKPRLKTKKADFDLDDFAIKGVSAKGVRMSRHEVRKVSLVKKKKADGN